MPRISYIGFVPGLEGETSLKNRTNVATPGTYAYAAERAARQTGLPFCRLDFQTASAPNPLLSSMGQSVATDIAILNDKYGGHGLIVASSIGAGVALQSLITLHDNDIDLPAVLLFKPAIDPLALIQMRMQLQGATADLTALHAGEISSLPIAVDATHYSPNPGSFLLTREHLKDADALRLLSDAGSRDLFRQKLQATPLPELRLQTAVNDQMCPRQITNMFAELVEGCSVKDYALRLMPGDRADDHSAELTAEIVDMVRQSGMRPA